MSAGKRCVLIFSLLLIYFVGKSVQNVKTSERMGRHLFPLLGYLHGYKAAQNYALPYPPFFYPPIIIVPSVTQQQAINIQKSYSDENYQENGGVFQYIQSAKLILGANRESSKVNEANSCDNDLNSDIDVARQADVNEENKKGNIQIFNTTSVINVTQAQNITGNETAISTATTATNSSLQSIRKDNVDLPNDFQVLPNDKNYNFTTNNTSINNVTIHNNITSIDNNESAINVSEGANSEIFDNTNETYPNAWYNNSLVDKISLTTPYVDNNDGWMYSEGINSLSGFRPLAGLYYDGFLDKPVTKRSGFTPIKSKLDSRFFTAK